MAEYHHSMKFGSIALKAVRRTTRITMITLVASTLSLRETTTKTAPPGLMNGKEVSA